MIQDVYQVQALLLEFSNFKMVLFFYTFCIDFCFVCFYLIRLSSFFFSSVFYSDITFCYLSINFHNIDFTVSRILLILCDNIHLFVRFASYQLLLLCLLLFV